MWKWGIKLDNYRVTRYLPTRIWIWIWDLHYVLQWTSFLSPYISNSGYHIRIKVHSHSNITQIQDIRLALSQPDTLTIYTPFMVWVSCLDVQKLYRNTCLACHYPLFLMWKQSDTNVVESCENEEYKKLKNLPTESRANTKAQSTRPTGTLRSSTRTSLTRAKIIRQATVKA